MFESFIGVNPWTAFFVLLNTLGLFFVLKILLFKPVKAMIDARQKEIDDMYGAADAARQNALDMQAEYEEKLADAQQASERIVREATARGQSREEEILRAAAAEAAAMRDKAAADIAQEKKKAINDAKDEISDLALAIAGKVVGRELNEADQSGLIDSFIEGLGEGV